MSDNIWESGRFIFDEVAEKYPRIPVGIYSFPAPLFWDMAYKAFPSMGIECHPGPLPVAFPINKVVPMSFVQGPERLSLFNAIDLHPVFGNNTHHYLYGEINGWLMFYGFESYYDDLMAMGSGIEWSERYLAMYRDPELADWFAAGFLDMDVVREFRANGVDIELAKATFPIAS